MTYHGALTRIEARQDELGKAVVLRVQLSADAVGFLDRAVIVIARAGGGAGADGLAAQLIFMAQSAGTRATLVDFSLEGDEGAAWDHSGIEFECRRLVISSELGAELGDVIGEKLDNIVIINLPPNTLLDFADIEPELLPIIKEQQRPLVVIWIDRPNDQDLDRIEGYRRAGGIAHCIVGVLAKPNDRIGDPLHYNVRLPDNLAAPVKIPLFPSQIANSFYIKRLTLRGAVERATVGQKSSFYTRLRAFASELKDAL